MLYMKKEDKSCLEVIAQCCGYVALSNTKSTLSLLIQLLASDVYIMIMVTNEITR